MLIKQKTSILLLVFRRFYQLSTIITNNGEMAEWSKAADC